MAEGSVHLDLDANLNPRKDIAMHTVETAHPTTALRRSLWIGVLVIASIAVSLYFACAAPFAAFAAAAALTLARRDALWLSAAVWLANQVVGYVLLDYPVNANSLAWGAAIGVAAIAATLAAQEGAARLRELPGIARAAATLAVAFVAYELVLVAVTPLLGGFESFAPDIVGQIFALNAFGFAGLFALTQIGALAGLAPHWRLARPAA
jgi:hypothetical protein